MAYLNHFLSYLNHRINNKFNIQNDCLKKNNLVNLYGICKNYFPNMNMLGLKGLQNNFSVEVRSVPARLRVGLDSCSST